jgi:hypothetical protein
VLYRLGEWNQNEKKRLSLVARLKGTIMHLKADSMGKRRTRMTDVTPLSFDPRKTTMQLTRSHLVEDNDVLLGKLVGFR